MEKLAKYPWLPIPLDGGAVTTCCATGKPFLDKVLLRATLLLLYLSTEKWRRISAGTSRLSEGVTIVSFFIFLVPAVLIELIYATVNAIGAIEMRKLFWTLSGFMLFAPTVLLLYFPAMYNPLTAFLISFGLFALAAWASYSQTEESAAKSANKRWLPQAEGACDHLLNLCYAIKRFQGVIACSCDDLQKHITQLDEPQIRLFLTQQCASSASTFCDVANHLESAYADWERFIRHNCQDGECEVIFDNLRVLRNRLERELGAGSHSRDAHKQKGNLASPSCADVRESP